MKHITATSRLQAIRPDQGRTPSTEAKVTHWTCAIAPEKEKCDF